MPPAASDGTSAPNSAPPWSTSSGDPLSPEPYQTPASYTPEPPSYSPGYAPLPQPAPEYPPTSQFPAVNYAPPGQAPDYGHGGYPPADYPPSGYPGPGQPGYPGQPGPPEYPGYGAPAPRKSNAPLIAVIVAVALLLCGGLATAGVLVTRSVTDRAKEAVKPITGRPTELPPAPTDEPNRPGLPTDLPTDGSNFGKDITVTYEVTGDGPANILYVDKLGGSPTRLEDAKLPWKLTVPMRTPALISVFAMRAGTDQGSIRCRALIDGKEVKSNSVDNRYFATVTCSDFDFD